MVFGLGWSREKYCRKCMAILPTVIKSNKCFCSRCGTQYEEEEQ